MTSTSRFCWLRKVMFHRFNVCFPDPAMFRAPTDLSLGVIPSVCNLLGLSSGPVDNRTFQHELVPITEEDLIKAASQLVAEPRFLRLRRPTAALACQAT